MSSTCFWWHTFKGKVNVQTWKTCLWFQQPFMDSKTTLAEYFLNFGAAFWVSLIIPFSQKMHKSLITSSFCNLTLKICIPFFERCKKTQLYVQDFISKIGWSHPLQDTSGRPIWKIAVAIIFSLTYSLIIWNFNRNQ